MHELTQLWWKFHFWFVYWFAVKPLEILDGIVNGKYGSNSKWYYAKYSGIPKNKDIKELYQRVSRYYRTK